MGSPANPSGVDGERTKYSGSSALTPRSPGTDEAGGSIPRFVRIEGTDHGLVRTRSVGGETVGGRCRPTQPAHPDHADDQAVALDDDNRCVGCRAATGAVVGPSAGRRPRALSGAGWPTVPARCHVWFPDVDSPGVCAEGANEPHGRSVRDSSGMRSRESQGPTSITGP